LRLPQEAIVGRQQNIRAGFFGDCEVERIE